MAIDFQRIGLVPKNISSLSALFCLDLSPLTVVDTNCDETLCGRPMLRQHLTSSPYFHHRIGA